MNTVYGISASLLVLMFSAPISAQDANNIDDIPWSDDKQCSANNEDCFELFNYCKPMTLMLINEWAGEYFVKYYADRVRTIAESRLRSARLYDSSSTNEILQIVVSFDEMFSQVLLLYAKPKYDLSSGITMVSPVRVVVMRGGSGDTYDADAVLQAISEAMDTFINDYLRVNEPACK